MLIVLLLVIIIVILLGGAGLIFSLIYGLLVLTWAMLPWLACMVGIMFIANLVKGFGSIAFHQPQLRRKLPPVSDQPKSEDALVRTYVDPAFHSNAPNREERKRLRERHSFSRRRE